MYLEKIKKIRPHFPETNDPAVVHSCYYGLYSRVSYLPSHLVNILFCNLLSLFLIIAKGIARVGVCYDSFVGILACIVANGPVGDVSEAYRGIARARAAFNRLTTSPLPYRCPSRWLWYPPTHRASCALGTRPEAAVSTWSPNRPRVNCVQLGRKSAVFVVYRSFATIIYGWPIYNISVHFFLLSEPAPLCVRRYTGVPLAGVGVHILRWLRAPSGFGPELQ